MLQFVRGLHQGGSVPTHVLGDSDDGVHCRSDTHQLLLYGLPDRLFHPALAGPGASHTTTPRRPTNVSQPALISLTRPISLTVPVSPPCSFPLSLIPYFSVSISLSLKFLSLLPFLVFPYVYLSLIFPSFPFLPPPCHPSFLPSPSFSHSLTPFLYPSSVSLLPPCLSLP